MPATAPAGPPPQIRTCIIIKPLVTSDSLLSQAFTVRRTLDYRLQPSTGDLLEPLTTDD